MNCCRPCFPCCYPSYQKMDETTSVNAKAQDTTEQRKNSLADLIKKDRPGSQGKISATNDQILQTISQKIQQSNGQKCRVEFASQELNCIQVHTFDLVQTKAGIEVYKITVENRSSPEVAELNHMIDGLYFKDFGYSEGCCVIL